MVASDSTDRRRLQLIVVAFHPDLEEVQRLKACLDVLHGSIGYCVVCNDYRQGEAADALEDGSDLFLRLSHNPGYGRAINAAVRELRGRDILAPFLGALNTDLNWEPGSFERLLGWLEEHPEVSLAVPRIVDPEGRVEQLCKRDPTLLALLSRRFFPEDLKPQWLRHYDRWFVMTDRDDTTVFDVPYLSGCCMLMRTAFFDRAGGFDERFFLYLEDADLTRRLRGLGRAVHLPVASVTHSWGRGNHRSLRLTFVNLQSAWMYFSKWGLRLW